MKRKKRQRKKQGKEAVQISELPHRLNYVHKHLDKLWEHVAVTNQRLDNVEVQLNLLSRLVTILCIENLGMKLGTFKRLVRRLEKETIADSEIRDLQDLFELKSRK